MLVDTIRADLTAAMKARDTTTVTTLRAVIAAVQEAEVAGVSAITLDDDGVQKVIAAQAKRRVEAAEAFTYEVYLERARELFHDGLGLNLPAPEADLGL